MKSLILSLILLANLALQPLGLSVPQESETLVQTNSDVQYENVVANASPAVVLITGYQDIPTDVINFQDNSTGETLNITVPISYGSGFFVTSDGYLLTNKHVVSKDDVKYTVNTGEEELDARIVYRDPDNDIAILKVEGSNFPTLTLKEGNKVGIGEDVIAIGNIFGRYIDSVSTGAIMSLDEDIVVTEKVRTRNGRVTLQSEDLNGLIEVSAKLYPGDSGGPLLNKNGEVIGVNVATVVNESVGYAIPIQIARQALQKAGVV